MGHQGSSQSGGKPLTNPHPRLQDQLALEELNIRQGIAANRSRTQNLQDLGLETYTASMGHLVRAFIEPVSKGIEAWRAKCKVGPGPRAVALKLVEGLDADVLALIALRVVLNEVSRVPNLTRVARKVGTAVHNEQRALHFESQVPGLYCTVKKTIAASPHSADPNYAPKVMRYVMNRYQIAHSEWSQQELVHVGMALIDQIITKTDMVMSEVVWKRAKSTLKLVPTPALVGWLEHHNTMLEVLNPIRTPMICPPHPWETQDRGGYYSEGMNQRAGRAGGGSTLVRTYRRGVIYDPEKMPAPFAAVNSLQAVALAVNPHTYAVVKHLWDNELDIPGCASRHDIPLPHKPADVATNPDARRIYKARAKEVHNANVSNRGKRIAAAQVFSVATRFSKEPEWWTPCFMDFRGRVYTTVQHLSPQGSDLAKGLIQFSRGEMLGERGLYWLKIQLANTYGVDKVSFDDRLAWVEANLPAIRRCGKTPLDERFWHDADEPLQFLAAAVDIDRALSSPDPSAYISHIPIRLDGTCNGIQHLAALSRDAVAGALVNLVPGDKPSDIYAEVAERSRSCLESLKGWASSPPSEAERRSYSSALTSSEIALLASLWLEYGVDRGLTKRPVMIVPYGGTLNATERYIDLYLTENMAKGKGHPFGPQRSTACKLLARVVWNSMGSAIEGPRQMMAWTRELAAVANKAKTPIEWVSPSGFPVVQACPLKGGTRITTRMGDSSIKLSVAFDLDRLDSRAQSRSLAPNWIHSLDAAALHLTVNAMVSQGVDQIIAVHDSYGCHARHVDLMAKTLREEFVKMNQTDLAERLREDVTKGAMGVPEDAPAPPAKGSLVLENVQHSKYFFA